MTNNSYSDKNQELQKVSLNPKGSHIQSNITVTENNWAFIDLQNLCKGVKERGWKIRWNSFRELLKEKYNVTKAVIFLGYLQENEYIYRRMKTAGFTLEFRGVKRLSDGTIDGGNVDADLASYVMDFKTEYSKAIIVADDGDYCRTIKSLDRQNKLKLIISSHTMRSTSELIKQTVNRNMILSIHSFRNQIEFSKIYNN